MDNKVYVMYYHYAMTDSNDKCASGHSIKLFSTHQRAYLAFMNLIRNELTDWSEIIKNITIKNDHVEADVPNDYAMTSTFEPKSGTFCLYEKNNFEKNHLYISFDAKPIL